MSVELLDRFARLQVWRRGDERAPHKPLLVLLALGRLLRDGRHALPFAEVEPALRRLLRAFGPARQALHPEYPFWRLRNDGVWTVRTSAGTLVREGGADPSSAELRARGAEGGFTPEVAAALRGDRRLAWSVVQSVLEAHFPASLHDDILEAAGLGDVAGDVVLVARRRRDPGFRVRVLAAYEHRCAVCGFNVRLADVALGLDAAHIMWHQAGGPDVERNGLALCVLHHKLFDRGAFTVSPERRVLISERVDGGAGFAEHLLRYHERPLGAVSDTAYRPADEFLDWHRRQVFHPPERAAAGSAAG